MSQKTAIVFDIDDTLTAPRKHVEQPMVDVLAGLETPFFLAAGSDLAIVQEQLLDPLHALGYRGAFDGFLCNGAVRYGCDLTGSQVDISLLRDFAFAEYVGPASMTGLLQLIDQTLNSPAFPLGNGVRVIGDRVIDRKAMINVAPAGRPVGALSAEAYANRDAFEAFDAESGYREQVLTHLQEQIKALPNGDQIYVCLGGKTSFDIVIEGNDKSYPMMTLRDEGFDRVVYFGDALFPGGNDEAVLRLIERVNAAGEPCPFEAVKVEGWRSTIERLGEHGFI